LNLTNSNLFFLHRLSRFFFVHLHRKKAISRVQKCTEKKRSHVCRVCKKCHKFLWKKCWKTL